MKLNNSNKVIGKSRRLTQKSLLLGGLISILAISAWFWIKQQPLDDEIPWILRTSHELNAKVWGSLFSPLRTATPQRLPAPGTPPRFNGNIGLEGQVDLKTWRLKVYTDNILVQQLSKDSMKWIPHTHTTTQFFCVEGWSTEFSYSGIKFSDFMDAYALSRQYRYVGLETPDQDYYVSIDMDSMLHPQTLLADEMNERPLSAEHGAPLRLIIPIKYGIKSLKRIGTIRLSNIRPPDYWAERGYDWYSGL